MSEFRLDDKGNIIGGISLPEFLYDKLTDEELVEVRKHRDDRFAMGYWYRGEATL